MYKNPNDMVNKFRELPAMPNIIMRALNVIKDPESSLKELAKIISYDQALSTKVLTLVNSAYYGFPQQITSINRAISLLGMSKTKNMVITVALRPMLTNQGDKELWKHSITTAVGCEYIANHFKIIDTDDAFIIGFLHDLGKIVLKLEDANTYEKVKQEVASGANIIETERKLFGTDHCQMGSLLTKKWQLPLLINNTVKYHHSPNLSSMPIACSLVYFIDSLVKEDFNPETLDQDIVNNLKINIDKPEILQENIFAKAQILLNELSN